MRYLPTRRRLPALVLLVLVVVVVVVVVVVGTRDADGGVDRADRAGLELRAKPASSPTRATRHCPDHRSGLVWLRGLVGDRLVELGRARPARIRPIASCELVLVHVGEQRRIARRLGRTLERLEDPVAAILYVFGRHGREALVVARCESGYSVRATNGQYLGMFQMGSYARSLYGHPATAIGQARAAHAYFVAAGSDWSPWSCKPW